MEDYMERQLTRLHQASSPARLQLRDKLLIFVCGVTVVVFLPFLHIGVIYRIWMPDKPEVDQARCDCGCFDTVFRGRYENPPSGYKHVYFNATRNTLRIWIYTVVGVLLAYESTRYLLHLARQRKLRLPMFAVFLSSIYPHYYGWWGLINYLNEDFYAQWTHQMFFTLTELLSTGMVLHLCNQDNGMIPAQLLVVISVSTMHVVVNSLDQLIAAFFLRQGWLFENVRNFSLLIPDLFHILVPFFELQIHAEKQQISMLQIFYKEELMMAALFVIIFTLIGKNL